MPSHVESAFLEQTGSELVYRPHEKIGVLVVDNFPRLGTLTAARFLEWVQANPAGVISLPPGKTPEFFIKETRRRRDAWRDAQTRVGLETRGIDPATKPETRGLRFVQI